MAADTTAGCLDAPTLAAFRSGRLSDAALDTLADHVTDCPACAAALESHPEPADDLLTALSRPPSCIAEDESAVVAHRLEAMMAAPTTCPPDTKPTTSARPTLLVVGAVLGQYELTAELGRGGMGQVFAARHRLMNRRVAVKVIRAEHFNRSLAGPRFRREIEALARLDHPHIVRALDADEADGLHFLVMEYVEGETLAGRVKRTGPLPVAEACRLMVQAADALDYAQRQGLVHRDIKPANFIIAADGTLKLLDLGLARFHDDGSSGDGLTGTGEVFGTPDYMAPEQWDNAHAVDIRADLYALGCTLYCLLTGQPPFGGPGVSTSQKMFAHVEKPPPPVRARRPDVPAGLAAVVERLLAKKPEDRYQTPAELRAALTPFAGEMAAATASWPSIPPPPERKAGSKPRRGWLPSAAALFWPGTGRTSAGTAWRRWAAVAGAVAGGLLLAVLLWDGQRSHDSHGGATALPDVGLKPPLPPRITAFRVRHFRGDPAQELGDLDGDQPVRADDDLRIQAAFGRPLYCYLVAYHPNGHDELCFPKDRAALPPAVSELTYPSDTEHLHGLIDGVGLQAFVLWTSAEPLPSFEAWRVKQGAAPWSAQPAAADAVWEADATGPRVLTRTVRGERAKIKAPAEVTALWRWWWERHHRADLRVIAFPVRAKP